MYFQIKKKNKKSSISIYQDQSCTAPIYLETRDRYKLYVTHASSWQKRERRFHFTAFTAVICIKRAQPHSIVFSTLQETPSAVSPFASAWCQPKPQKTSGPTDPNILTDMKTHQGKKALGSCLFSCTKPLFSIKVSENRLCATSADLSGKEVLSSQHLSSKGIKWVKRCLKTF